MLLTHFQREGKVPHEEMNRTWDAGSVPALREDLKGTILRLSDEWKTTSARGAKRTSGMTNEHETRSDGEAEVEGLLSSHKGKFPEMSDSEDEPVLVEHNGSATRRKGSLDDSSNL